MQWPGSRSIRVAQWLTFLVGCCVLVGVYGAVGDPYRLLGVSRNANLQVIRRAYKQLAKEWHPDKSDNPAAEAKFVEIKQAYEILSDPERRKMYDQHGITDEDSVNQRQDYSYYGRFNTDPLDELFSNHGGRFHFQDHDITVFHKMSVTTRQFENSLVPKSHHTPQLVLFYTDWCFPCLQATPLWRKLVDTLEPLGVSLATVHAGREPALARKVGVSNLPCLVLLLDGKHYVYRESLGGSVQKVIEFIRHKMPYKMVPHVDDNNVDDYLNGWQDNRVRALVFEKQQHLRLRYLVTAFHFRDRVAFGFVQMKSTETGRLQQRYKISTDMDTVLLFNEYPHRPIASVSMSEIPSQTLHHVITSNQYLALPRLSSQRVLEALCPAEWNRPRKRLCVVLVTGATAEHDAARQALRQFAQDSHYGLDRVRFVYLYHERQTEFVESMWESPGHPLLRIVIIWRRDTSHIKYEWLDSEWRVPQQEGAGGGARVVSDEEGQVDGVATKGEASANINDTKQRLEETISRLLKSTEALSYEAVVKDLLDEHAQGLFSRIVTKLLITADIVYESLTKDQLLPALSIIATILFIIGAGYFMAYLVRLEEESIQQQRKAKRNGNNNNEPTAPSSPAGDSGDGDSTFGDVDLQCGGGGTSTSTLPPRELYLHELRAEKYNGLVRLLKPGCRTIVLFVDVQSRLQLIPAFHKIIWPYRKNKTLMFAHMSLERGLSWYRELLQLSLPEPRDLNINPRNCVGTVLALNGHRKYFCMFHAKHSESRAEKKNKVRATATTTITTTTKAPDDPELGAFIGFESESSESDEEEILLQGTLLDGLPNWLDRLFEGSTRRYYINYWPDFPTK